MGRVFNGEREPGKVYFWLTYPNDKYTRDSLTVSIAGLSNEWKSSSSYSESLATFKTVSVTVAAPGKAAAPTPKTAHPAEAAPARVFALAPPLAEPSARKAA